MCIVMSDSELLSYSRNGSHMGVYCKGNDQISRFKCAIQQTSNVTSLNVVLFSGHTIYNCRIDSSQRLLMNYEFGTLSSKGGISGFPRCPSTYCLRRSLVVYKRSRSPLCPDWFNSSSSGGIRSHALPQDKQEPA